MILILFLISMIADGASDVLVLQVILSPSPLAESSSPPSSPSLPPLSPLSCHQLSIWMSSTLRGPYHFQQHLAMAVADAALAAAHCNSMLAEDEEQQQPQEAVRAAGVILEVLQEFSATGEVRALGVLGFDLNRFKAWLEGV